MLIFFCHCLLRKQRVSVTHTIRQNAVSTKNCFSLYFRKYIACVKFWSIKELFHGRYAYFSEFSKGHIMNIQYQFRTWKITCRRRSRLVVIAVRCIRNFGDAECEDIQPGTLYSDIYTLYADRGRDNEISYRRTLCSGTVHVAFSSCNSAQRYVCDCCF